MKRATVFFALLLSLAQLSGSDSTTSKQPRPRVSLLLVNNSVRIGEPITVSYSIQNSGTSPFCVFDELERLTDRGGFQVEVVPPPGARWLRQEHGLAFVRPETRKTIDLTQELQQRGLRLMPGAFYGRTAQVPFKPLSAGTYRASVTYYGPTFRADETQRSRVLPCPAVPGKVVSDSIVIEVRP